MDTSALNAMPLRLADSVLINIIPETVSLRTTPQQNRNVQLARELITLGALAAPPGKRNSTGLRKPRKIDYTCIQFGRTMDPLPPSQLLLPHLLHLNYPLLPSP